MIVRCGTALCLNTVTISGCRENLCFVIGKSVAVSHDHDIIIDHQINPIRANGKLRTMHLMTNYKMTTLRRNHYSHFLTLCGTFPAKKGKTM